MPFAVTLGLLGYCAVTANAESVKYQGEASISALQMADNELGDEYKELLRIIETKKAPIQSIDGTLNIAGRPGMGAVDSDVILIEFGDFQCPFCKRHLKNAAQKIYRNLVLSNKLRYVYMDFPVEIGHPFAKKAAIAARCAEEQGKYWEMRNALFNNQKALQEIFLAEHAKNAGIDAEKFNACIESGRYAAAIAEDQIVGRSLGIKGTPTFYIGLNRGDEVRIIRKIQGVHPYEVFEKEILQAKKISLSRTSEPINNISRSGN